jgi:hypothetical protein
MEEWERDWPPRSFRNRKGGLPRHLSKEGNELNDKLLDITNAIAYRKVLKGENSW